jgi:uroporphyrinogen III methyltransferase/synthase
MTRGAVTRSPVTRRHRRPLAGRSILVTRPRAQSRPLCDRLRALGARVVVIPTIEIVPPPAGGAFDRAMRRFKYYDWVVLTSANGARACVSRATAIGIDLRSQQRVRWAAVGPATAAVLRRARVHVAMIPSRFLTEAIGRELPDVRGRRILLARTDVASPALVRALRARGAKVDVVAAYRTVVGPRRAAPRVKRVFSSGGVDIVVFTSASTVRGLLRLLGTRRKALEQVTNVCIGPVTAAAVSEAGLRPGAVAREYTIDGLIEALLEVSDRGTNRPAR